MDIEKPTYSSTVGLPHSLDDSGQLIPIRESKEMTVNYEGTASKTLQSIGLVNEQTNEQSVAHRQTYHRRVLSVVD